MLRVSLLPAEMPEAGMVKAAGRGIELALLAAISSAGISIALISDSS